MKKLLMALALAGASTVAITACGPKAETAPTETKDTFFEPQVAMPTVYLEKSSNSPLTPEQIKEYVSQFIVVTFAEDYKDTTYEKVVDTSMVDVSKEQIYKINYEIKYANYSKKYTGSVAVVDRGVVNVQKTAALPAFTPSLEMDELIDYTQGIVFTEKNGTPIDIDAAVRSGKIVIDDSTVRYAVPGVHLVKYTIKTEEGHIAHYYREVSINAAARTDKATFDKYFTLENGQLACKKDAAIDYPKHLMIPSEYYDDATKLTVKATNYKQYGCDFKGTSNDAARAKFAKIETLTVQEGHTRMTDGWLSLSPYDVPVTPETPAIKNIFLPETLTSIEGTTFMAGSDIKTLVLPRSLKRLDDKALGDGNYQGAWKLKNLVVLGMPLSKTPSQFFGKETAAAWFDTFTSYGQTGKTVYFYADYMMGASADAAINTQFRDIWNYAKLVDRTKYINSFVNYNRILIN